jgi:phosphoglycolate phosphatase
VFKPELILSDLDGTLVDSVPDLAYAADQMMQQLDLPARGVDSVRLWVGNGVERLVKRTLTGEMYGEPPSDLLAKAFPLFMDCYGDTNGQRSQLYPGVREGLVWLHEHYRNLGCITNKSKRFTRPLLEQLGIADYFGIIVAGDSLPAKKPDPLPLTHCMDFFSKKPAQTLMIGDSTNDVQAARNAGCPIICVDYGYNHGEDIRLSGADAVISHFAELQRLLPL